jgi:hypothetical protein
LRSSGNLWQDGKFCKTCTKQLFVCQTYKKEFCSKCDKNALVGESAG